MHDSSLIFVNNNNNNPPGAGRRVVAEGLSTRQDSHLLGKPGAGRWSPLRVSPGVCRCCETSPMMGDTRLESFPSGVTHAPADPSPVLSD